MMMRLSWRFSAAQWAVLTDALFPHDLPPVTYPAPIQVQSSGRTDVEWRRIRDEVRAQLVRLGLFRANRMDADLEAALHLLHRPVCWVDSVWQPGSPTGQLVRTVVAVHGTAGVAALQHPDEPGATLLEAIPVRGLAAAVVGRLPAHPPGQCPVTAVPLRPSAAPERDGVLVSVSASLTGAERSIAATASVLNRPHARAGQIAANVRDPSGRVRRSEVLRWCDNPDGRYQMTVSKQPGGPDLLVVNPADPQRLGHAVQRLLSSVRPRDQ
ncbi:MAG: ESX secretion-associated protein EspG [Pseudonocardiales bacterium]